MRVQEGRPVIKDSVAWRLCRRQLSDQALALAPKQPNMKSKQKGDVLLCTGMLPKNRNASLFNVKICDRA